MRRTLKQNAEFAGVGLHGGQTVQMTVSPAPSGAGISFLRIDVPLSMQGGRDTVFAGQIFHAHGRQDSFAPSLRMVTDMAEPSMQAAMVSMPEPQP